MKQFVDQTQRTNLIEIIGEPTSIEFVEKKFLKSKVRYNFSLGELIEHCPHKLKKDNKEYDMAIIGSKLRYRTKNNCYITYGKKVELIDNIYEFIMEHYKK
jgi:hypothetical protein